MAESLLTTYCNELLSYVDDNGVIIEGNEAKTAEVIAKINDLTGLTISIDQTNHIIVNDVSQQSKEALKTALNAAAQATDLSQYFSGRNYEVGILGATGGVEFAKRILAANGSSYSSEDSFSFTYEEDTATGRYRLISDNFIIEIDETVEDQLARVVVSDTDENFHIDIFPKAGTEGFEYLKYYIYKGGSGDFYIKGYATNDSTAPDPENAEEEFTDIEMNRYSISEMTVEGVTAHYIENTSEEGGFAVIAMKNVAAGASATDTDACAAVIMGINRQPLHIVMNDAVENTTLQPAWTLNTIWQSVVPSPGSKVHLAPIFAPSSLFYISRYSRWAMVSPQDGVYDMVADTNYRYDHGFCLKRY